MLFLKLFHSVYAPFSAATFEPVAHDALLLMIAAAPSISSMQASTTPSTNYLTSEPLASLPNSCSGCPSRLFPQTCISVTPLPNRHLMIFAEYGALLRFVARAATRSLRGQRGDEPLEILAFSGETLSPPNRRPAAG